MSDVEPLPEENMWNRSYQQTRHEVGKLTRGNFTSVHSCCARCFKNLIHVFIALFLLCVLGLVYKIKEEVGLPHLDGAWDRQIRALDKYISNNGAYYGIKKVGDNMNFTDGLKNYMTRSQGTVEDHGRLVDTLGVVMQPHLIHPLYVELQKQSPLSRVHGVEGHVHSDEIPDYKLDERDVAAGRLTASEVYRKYVSRSLPFVYRGFAKDWPLYGKLQAAVQEDIQAGADSAGRATASAKLDEFMAEMFTWDMGSRQITSQIPWTELTRTAFSSWELNQHDGSGQVTKVMTYPEARELASVYVGKRYFVQDLDCNHYRNWHPEENYRPNPFNAYLSFRRRGLTIWRDFKRKPVSHDYEQFVCVLKGKETFRTVSPIFRPNIYAGIGFTGIKSSDSPLDFFDPRMETWSVTKVINFNEVTLSRGDCLYIPAYFYVQSRTEVDGQYAKEDHTGGESILLSHWYQSHSQMVDMVFDGIDDNKWIDLDYNKYDKMLENFVGNIV